jgi:hypothetical protein
MVLRDDGKGAREFKIENAENNQRVVVRHRGRGVVISMGVAGAGEPEAGLEPGVGDLRRLSSAATEFTMVRREDATNCDRGKGGIEN